MSRKYLLLWMGLVFMLTTAGTKGGTLDPREIALIMESTVVDLDLTAIAIHHGNDTTNSLQYVSRIDADGWQGRLWGTYRGRAVDIGYNGVITYVGGLNSQYNISYASDWLYDGQTGSGSGSGIYTDPDFSFEIDLINMEVSGSVSVSYGIATLTLAGSKSFSTHTATVSGSASALDLPLVGSAASATLALSYNQLTGEYESTVNAQVLGGWLYDETETINKGTIRRPKPTPPVPPPPPPTRPDPPPSYPYVSEPYDGGFDESDPTSPGYNNMTASTVPVPAALTGGLALLAVVGIGGVLRCRARD